MDSSDDEGPPALPHESGLALAEDGSAVPYAKACPSGGLGLFTRGKPLPIEYRCDTSLSNGGFLNEKEADGLWESQVSADSSHPSSHTISFLEVMSTAVCADPGCDAVTDRSRGTVPDGGWLGHSVVP